MATGGSKKASYHVTERHREKKQKQKMNVRRTRLLEQQTSVSQLAALRVCVYDVASFLLFKCFYYDCCCAHWLPGGQQASRPSHVVVAVAVAGSTTHVLSGAKWTKRHNGGVTSMETRACPPLSPHAFWFLRHDIFLGKKSDFVCSQHSTEMTLVLFVLFFLLSWFVLKYHFEWRYCHM